jgi:predicted LPLAT superfamily acyltransferase
MNSADQAWSQKAERGSALLIGLIIWLARVVGRRFCRLLLYPITFYFLVSDRTARRASAEFLTAVQGQRARLRDVFMHIYAFASTLLDRVYMATGEFDRFEVTIEGLQHVDRAIASGRGCLLLGSHLGSFDLMMLAHRAMDGRPVTVMMRVDPRARLRQMIGIDDSSLSLIRVGEPGSYLRAHEAIQRGEIVGILADRVDGSAPSLPASFLGRTALLPVAPHVLAARSEASIVMCFGLYEGGNRYRIEFVDFGAAAPCKSRGSALQPVVDRYAQLLEAYARKYPLNWFNFYGFWPVTEGRTP